ncbi:MAG TPA: hypothetical protein PLW40_00705 [Syntrophales bacterium]|nr:hypothetical protein [Syntrophales bacterium]
MKVIHLPSNVGGMAWGLAQGERLLGLDATVLVCSMNWLNYKADKILYNSDRYLIYKLVKRLEAFFQIRNKYDIYHFNSGATLLDFPNIGLHLLDISHYNGKNIITFNGCDARLKYETMNRVNVSACHEKDCYEGLCNKYKIEEIKKERIKKISRYVKHVFAVNPDLMYNLPVNKTSFLPYAVAGWNDIEYVPFKVKKNRIKIVHAPTNRGAKGSKYIIAALDNLSRKYKYLEINIIEKVPYKKALELYIQADIVVDQVLIGWYGGLGVEVMKMGKPLAVFIREEDLKFIPTQMAQDLKETIINVNKLNIESELAKYIENIDLLKAKSEASLYYVHRWHDPKYVASITKNIYESV